MSYCSQQDLIDRFDENELIQLTDRDNLGAINTAVLGQAIADARAEIDGYLAGRHDLPLASVPVVLVRSACDIARYYLYDNAVTEQVEKRYDAVIRFLEQVSRGKISLGVDSSGAAPEPSDGAQMQSGGRIFGRDDDGFL